MASHGTPASHAETLSVTLHKTDARGGTREWHVEVYGGVAVTTWGTLGGKQTTKRRAYVQGDGKQKRTHEQQAVFDAVSIVRKKMREGCVDVSDGPRLAAAPVPKHLKTTHGTSHGMTDGTAESKDAVSPVCPARPMLARKLQSMKTPLPTRVFVQPKLDGMRCIVSLVDGSMWSRGGKRVDKLVHIADMARDIVRSIRASRGGDACTDTFLDGELFVVGESFSRIMSMVRHGDARVRYHVYDIITDAPFSVRTSILHKLFAMNKAASSGREASVGETGQHDEDAAMQLVSTHECNATEVDAWHAKYVSEGYEGLMVRTDKETTYRRGARSASLLKLKEFCDAEFECVGSTAEKHTSTQTLGALVLCMEDGRTFNARPAQTREQRAELWEQRASIVGRQITVRYFELTDDGIPRFPVAMHVRETMDM